MNLKTSYKDLLDLNSSVVGLFNNNVNLQRNIPFLYDERTLNTRPSLFGSEAKIKEKFSMTHISRSIYLKLCNFFLFGKRIQTRPFQLYN